MCTVKPYHILAKRFGLFAVRLPSLSQGNGLLRCGITFGIFTHVLHGSRFFFINLLIYLYIKRNIHYGNLEEGYNVIRSETKR